MCSQPDLQRLATLALRQRRRRLLEALRAVPPDLIHATLLERYLTCGRPQCACHQGRKHGPFYYLHRCLPKGRLSSLLLKSPAQLQQARTAVQHYSQWLADLDQLSWLNLELLRRGEALGPPAPP